MADGALGMYGTGSSGGYDYPYAAATGTVDPYMMALMSGGGGGAPASGGALSSPAAASLMANYQPSADVQNTRAMASAIGGSPAEVSGALSQSRQAMSQASADKYAAIQRAMSILQASGQNQVNLPALAAFGAMMGPTVNGAGFAGSVSNAVGAAVPQIQRQREIERANALAMGQMGEAGADTAYQAAHDQMADTMNRLNIARGFTQEAGTQEARDFLTRERLVQATAGNESKERIAAEQAAAKERAAEIMGGARITAADLNANKQDWEYAGPDPSNPQQGLWVDKRHMGINPGPISQAKGAGATSKQVADAQWLKQQGIAPDINTAYAMVRATATQGNEPAAFTRAITARADSIGKTTQGSAMTPEEIIALAREQVVVDWHNNPGGMKQMYGANAGTQQQSVPVAQGATAPIPGTGPAPAAAPAPPPLPRHLQGVGGVGYNPEKGLWRDPRNGALYRASPDPSINGTPYDSGNSSQGR